MRKAILFPGVGSLLGLLFVLFVAPSLLPDLIIAVACMIPLVLCFVVAARVSTSRIVLTLTFLLCSAAEVWFLASFGEDLLPSGTTAFVGNAVGGYEEVDATGGYMAAWTTLVLTLFGLIGAWIMIADVLETRRKARLAQGKVPLGRPKLPG